MAFIRISKTFVINTKVIKTISIEKREDNENKGKTKIELIDGDAWHIGDRDITPEDIYNLIMEAEKTEAERLQDILEERGL